MNTLRTVENICSVILVISIGCMLLLLFYSRHGSNGLTSFQNSFVYILIWGLIISFIVLIISAVVEFLVAVKENR